MRRWRGWGPDGASLGLIEGSEVLGAGVAAPRAVRLGQHRLHDTVVELAVLAAGIPERTTCHSFATHLPKDDSDIRNVQELQGHQDAATTVLDEQIYTLLRQKFGEHLSKVRISLGVKIRESTSHHTTIIEHAGASDHAAQFLEFTRAMIARMEKSLTEAPQRGDQTTPASGSDATDELAVGEVSHG